MSEQSVNDGSPGTTPGFYGKTPRHGDFIKRRLPRSFVDPWDDWLQRADLGQSRPAWRGSG